MTNSTTNVRLTKRAVDAAAAPASGEHTLWDTDLKGFGLRIREGGSKELCRNLGDVRPVGKGVSELRIDTGLGYRLYYAAKGEEIIILLAGGDKPTQARDIETALVLWEDWKAANP